MADNKRRVGRRQQRIQQAAQERRRRRLLIWGPVAAVVLALIGLTLYQALRPELSGLVEEPDQARGHDDNAQFVNTGLPPMGGIHRPIWQNCGIYDTPVDDSLAVHSLEHGAVWLAYHPDLPDETVSALRREVAGKSFVIMAPYPDLQGQVVMTAWGRQLVLDTLPDDRVGAFIDRYRGLGPEPGASCSDGVGTPIG